LEFSVKGHAGAVFNQQLIVGSYKIIKIQANKINNKYCAKGTGNCGMKTVN